MYQVIFIFISFIFVSYAQAQDVFEPKSFSLSEHMMIGDEIRFRFSQEIPPQSNITFHLPNTLCLTYGEIISFGDLYGILGKAISNAPTFEEQKKRFLAIFNQFAMNPKHVKEANLLKEVIHDEANFVKQMIASGQTPQKAYAKIAMSTARKINCITGGGCDKKLWWTNPGRLLLLTKENYDHFGANALIAYDVGHRVALDLAVEAHHEQNLTKLYLAYAINGLASHFLSDRFAAGHIRTPRNELPAHITIPLIGSALAGYMHNEEGRIGIHVHNLRGEQWIAYGDNMYLTQEAYEQRQRLKDALQTSIDEIFIAYTSGNHPISTINLLIPYANEVMNQANKDLSPLFYWDQRKHKLFRRKKINHIHDKHWTADWWGLSTLTLLEEKYGIEMGFSAKN